MSVVIYKSNEYKIFIKNFMLRFLHYHDVGVNYEFGTTAERGDPRLSSVVTFLRLLRQD